MKIFYSTDDDRSPFSLSASELAVPIRAEGTQLTEKTLVVCAPGYETSGITFPGSALYDIRISPDFIREKRNLLEISAKKINLERDSFFQETSLKHLTEIRGLLATLSAE